jgi:hypothetical protein
MLFDNNKIDDVYTRDTVRDGNQMNSQNLEERYTVNITLDDSELVEPEIEEQ